MNSEKVWLQWVRHGKAYTITKSRREKVRRERLRAVIILMDYTIGVRSAQSEEWKQAYRSTLENDFNISDIDSLCLSIIREKEDDWEEFCFARKVINTVFYYNESSQSEYMSRKIHETFIRKLMADAQTPYAGATVRRVFKEIETKLIEAAR
ncbi:hypothetical protein T231_03340 [Tannerella sp. oral taxon BU063 isolate Cell 6/7/9]|uniref:Uncharacterized protein n=2 Tax=Tannerella serpentiformis TaxID=712710 RepID=W2CU59_9BACT|nr:hypothetical protein T231_03340 [Tannerella sp. oral taxon BU063 isolate Cell 6/7/9]ETK11505.1 hypothetical protein T235_15090 [Tannerella sp. oral taxon BU063 isolate Cell 8/11]